VSFLELLEELNSFNSGLGIVNRVIGIDFVRTFEYDRVLRELDFRKKGLILDIGTWRSPLSMFLSSKGFNAVMLDLSAEKLARQKRIYEKTGRGKNFKGKAFFTAGDATDLPLKSGSFDWVLCISTIEHIEGSQGDSKAAKEIARVLKKSGKALLTVPFSQKYREGTWGVFFSRYYDRESLSRRIVKPSGLKLAKLNYIIGGDARRASDFFYFRLPRYLRHALGWLQHRSAKKHLGKGKAGERDAFVCFLLLKK